MYKRQTLTSLFLLNWSESSETNASEIPPLPTLTETSSEGSFADLAIEGGKSWGILLPLNITRFSVYPATAKAGRNNYTR